MSDTFTLLVTELVRSYTDLLDEFNLEEAISRSMQDEVKGQPAATTQALNSLEVFRVGPDRLARGSNSCLVCLSDFDEGETCCVLPCQHGFHRKCVFQWLKISGTCPVCRQSVEKPDA